MVALAWAEALKHTGVQIVKKSLPDSLFSNWNESLLLFGKVIFNFSKVRITFDKVRITLAQNAHVVKSENNFDKSEPNIPKIL